MSFAMIIGFMVAALMFAKKSSAMGTSMAMSGAGKLAFGSLGFVGRNTAGRYFNYKATQAAKSQDVRKSAIGQFALRRYSSLAKNSFDGRNSAGGKQLAGLVGDLGTAQKGGYHGTVHDADEARKKLVKEFKNSDKEIAEIEAAEGTDGNGGEIKELKDELRATTEAHKQELIGLEVDLAGQRKRNEDILAPQRGEIDRKRIELEQKEAALKKAGNTANQEQIAVLEKEVRRARESLVASTGTYQASKDQAEKDLEPFTEPIEAAKKSNADFTKSQNEKVVALQEKVKLLKSKPQRDYADYLHGRGEEQSILNNSFTRNITGVGKNADHHARDAIKRNLNKSDAKKLQESLDKANARKDNDASTGTTKTATTDH